MKYITPPLQGLLVTFLNLLCPFLVPLALLFAKWEKEPSSARAGEEPAIRGDLPKWLSWFSTPDERLPGGMYEPTVAAMYEKRGKWLTSWYWLGVRNCLFGLALRLGKPTTDYIPDLPLGFWERGDIWRYSVKLGPFKFLTGYKVYKLLDGSFKAAPCFSIMLRP